ncbi:hypothetical protein R1flu_016811 [Riccia fluitans]|uniref:Uncharacterized protein n=1 Tax=Riccia fluitans TaxID=41844 RepID=A0ABD1YNQ9_9MARC
MSNQTISDHDTPDPWMIAANGRFYLTFTCGDRIEIWASDNMEDFRSAVKSDIYTCSAQPGKGNPSHRTTMLRSSIQDPLDPNGWAFLGPLKGLPDHWHIDATVFTMNNRLFCVYSGWPLWRS